MKSMIKAIAIAALLFSTMGIISCEDSSSDSSDSSSRSGDDQFLLTERVVLTTKDYIIYQEGDLPMNFHTSNNKYLVIPTSSTRIMLQRESCSGFSESDANSVGGTCVLKFYTSQVDYGSGKPYPIRPQEIWIRRAACEPQAPPDDSDCCNPCN
jgi:hypothetical protein